jgi:hypothetical protein
MPKNFRMASLSTEHFSTDVPTTWSADHLPAESQSVHCYYERAGAEDTFSSFRFAPAPSMIREQRSATGKSASVVPSCAARPDRPARIHKYRRARASCGPMRGGNPLESFRRIRRRDGFQCFLARPAHLNSPASFTMPLAAPMLPALGDRRGAQFFQGEP